MKKFYFVLRLEKFLISVIALSISLCDLYFSCVKYFFVQPVSKYTFSNIGVFVYHYFYSMSNLFFGRFVRLCLKRIVQFLKTRTNKFGKICTTSFCSMQINIFILHENNLIAKVKRKLAAINEFSLLSCNEK